MSDAVIEVDNLGKRYRIGLEEEAHDTLVGALRSWLSSPLRNFRRVRELSRFDEEEAADTIWALRGVSFSVAQGEMVGIIGRNGAGKSTLLKILSRITEPTKGKAHLRGRVASLLEVGTGFHSELTGRENIYLNGTLLGMSKAEVDRKFDEIVAFSGVEQFIDTPVKRYSSGMHVRLAFAVAAHLEPEILLIDEVLAVGDLKFQKKCFGKMKDVASQGRTVLVVSHNLSTIESLCQRAVLLDHGRIMADGPTTSVVEQYLDAVDGSSHQRDLGLRSDRKGGERFRFTEARFVQGEDRQVQTVQTGSDVEFQLEYTAKVPAEQLVVSVAFHSRQGHLLTSLRSDAVVPPFEVGVGGGKLVCAVPKLPLSPGQYFYSVIAYANGRVVDWVRDAGSLTVAPGDFYGTDELPAKNHQTVLVPFEWSWQPSQTQPPTTEMVDSA